MGNSQSIDVRVKGGYTGDSQLAGQETPGLPASAIDQSLGLKEIYAPASAHAE